MEDLNIMASNNPRKLLLGERAEVRQRERGLRGSWHSGTVIRVKCGRRVVEYDELFTKDGSTKLKECISLYEKIRSQTSGRRSTASLEWDKSGSPCSDKRGFIRPIPPSCLMPPRHDWKRGLLVDAFYNDAWWEGILLHDVRSSECEESKAKIFFPDEGDELEVLLKDIRVSQEWDEVWGIWAIRGYWFLEGRIELTSLKKICMKAPCPLRTLWRQKSFCNSEDFSMQEERINNQHEVAKSLKLEMQKTPVQHISMAFTCELPSLRSNGDHCQEGTDINEEKCRIVEDETSISAEAGENINKVDRGNYTVCTTNVRKESESARAHISILDGSLVDASRDESSIEASVGKKIKKRKVSLGHVLEYEGKMRHRSINDLGKGTNNQDIIKQQGHRSSSHNSRRMVDTVSSACKSSSKGMEKNDPSTAIYSEIHAPLRVNLREAREAAIEFLLSNGWKIELQTHSRHGSRMTNKSAYISPDGCRFVSLKSACSGLRTENKISTPVDKGKHNLIDAYMIAGGLRIPVTEQTILSDKSIRKSLFNRNRSYVPEVIDSECGSATLQENRTNIPVESHDELTVKKKKLTLLMKNMHKRKCEGYSGTKCKRGRAPIKAIKHLQENKGSGVAGSCRMQVVMSFPKRGTGPNDSQHIGEPPQFKKSTVLSWLIDKSILKENEPVCYVNRKDGHIMKTGKVTQEGVQCDCCNKIFTLSNFEAHAGSKLHRPSANLFLDDGRSISDCQLEACTVPDMKDKEGSIIDVSDDICGVCKDGGELILCDHCPATFHADCIGLKVIPEGDWYCPKCSCGVCGDNQLSADLCSRIVRCTQCELQYHMRCVPACPIQPVDQANSTVWFCDKKCQQIFMELRRQVGRVHHMENGFSWMLLRSMKKEHGIPPTGLQVMAEHHSKLSVAHDVMQECFMPMIDPQTRINLISQALYSRSSKIGRLNYGGFYTVLLEREDELISVATLRVHGARFAEMPLIGTRFQYRRQGMCRRLMNVLEEILKSVGVEMLILPAVPELQDTWIGVFGFQQISLLESQELSKLSLMTFPGTTLLQKRLLQIIPLSDPVDQPHTCNGVGSFQTPSYESVGKFFTMAHESLVNGCRHGNTSMSSGMLNYVQEVTSDNQCTPMSSNAGIPKNKKCHIAESGSNDGASGVSNFLDDDTRVVIGTTRSKRPVKSTKWVADGLRELKGSKQPKPNPVIEENSTKRPASQSVKNCGNDEDTGLGHVNTLNESMHPQFTGSALKDEIQSWPKFYSRRKKGECMQDYNRSVCQLSTPLIDVSTPELVSSSLPSGHFSLTGRFLREEGSSMERLFDSFDIMDFNQHMQTDELIVMNRNRGM